MQKSTIIRQLIFSKLFWKISHLRICFGKRFCLNIQKCWIYLWKLWSSVKWHMIIDESKNNLKKLYAANVDVTKERDAEDQDVNRKSNTQANKRFLCFGPSRRTSKSNLTLFTTSWKAISPSSISSILINRFTYQLQPLKAPSSCLAFASR